MAVEKKVSKVEASEKAPEEATKVYIDLATSEEDVVAYDQAGAFLVFLKKRFRKLSKESLEALSHDNRKRYLEARKAVDDLIEASRPAPRAQIIDPLGGHEGALLNVKITDPKWEKEWHVCWKHCVEQDSLTRVGYKPVRAGEDPIECGLKPAGSTFVLKDPRDRHDLDLILMKVKQITYLQHMNAVAQASQDKVKGYREKFSSEVEESSEGRLKGSIEEEETEKVSLRRSDLRPVGS